MVKVFRCWFCGVRISRPDGSPPKSDFCLACKKAYNVK